MSSLSRAGVSEAGAWPLVRPTGLRREGAVLRPARLELTVRTLWRGLDTNGERPASDLRPVQTVGDVHPDVAVMPPREGAELMETSQPVSTLWREHVGQFSGRAGTSWSPWVRSRTS